MKIIYPQTRVLFLSLSFMFVSFANAQWLDLSSSRLSIDFSEGPIGFMGSSNGVISKSEDYGSTWRNVSSPLASNYLVHDIFVSNNGSRVVALANSFTDGTWVVYKSTMIISDDGGLNWKTVFNYSGASLHAFFSDELNGWITVLYDQANKGYKSWRTSDGGLTWVDGGQENIRTIYFYDQLHGWAYTLKGFSSNLLKTDNGGITWSISKTYGPELGISNAKLRVFNDHDAVIINGDGSNSFGVRGIYNTSSGGDLWTPLSLPSTPDVQVNDIFFSNAQTGWVIAGDRHTVLKTIDGGTTWSLLLSSNNYSYQKFNALFFRNELDGFVIGDYGFLASTHDGGVSWQRENYLPIERISDAYLKENDSWILGQQALIHSNDQLASWDTVKNITINKATKIDFADDHGMAVGPNFINTVDNGQTWQNVQQKFDHLPAYFTWQDMKVYVRNANVVWLSGVNGYIWKSSDGGKNYTLKKDWPSYSTGPLYNLAFQTEDVIWAYAKKNETSGLKSIDGGITWQAVDQRIVAIYFINSSIGWRIVYSTDESKYNLFKTIDGAMSWQKISTLDYLYSFSSPELFFADEYTGWISFSNNVYKTTNSGAAWTSEPIGVNYALTGMRFHISDNGKITALATGSGVVKYTGSFNQIPVISLAIPTNLKLLDMGLTSVTLTWQDNSKNEDGFYIERTNSSGIFERIDTLQSDITTYKDLHLPSATQASYRVSVFKTNRMISYGDSIVVEYKILNAPTSLKIDEKFEDALKLAWKYDFVDNEGFILERRESTGQFTVLAKLSSKDRSYLDQDLLPSTQHSYRLYAYVGNTKSIYSEISSGQTLPLVPLLTPDKFNVKAILKTEIDLQWIDNNDKERGFVVEKMNPEGQFFVLDSLLANTTNYTDNKLLPGNKYTYRLKAVGYKNKESDYTEAVTTTTLSDSEVVVTNIEQLQVNELSPYPNPTSSEISIVIPGQNKIQSIELVNSLGTIVYTRQLTLSSNETIFTIEIGHLPTGIYILKTCTGIEIVNTSRIVKIP